MELTYIDWPISQQLGLVDISQENTNSNAYDDLDFSDKDSRTFDDSVDITLDEWAGFQCCHSSVQLENWDSSVDR